MQTKTLNLSMVALLSVVVGTALAGESPSRRPSRAGNDLAEAKMEITALRERTATLELQLDRVQSTLRDLTQEVGPTSQILTESHEDRLRQLEAGAAQGSDLGRRMANLEQRLIPIEMEREARRGY